MASWTTCVIHPPSATYLKCSYTYHIYRGVIEQSGAGKNKTTNQCRLKLLPTNAMSNPQNHHLPPPRDSSLSLARFFLMQRSRFIESRDLKKLTTRDWPIFFLSHTHIYTHRERRGLGWWFQGIKKRNVPFSTAIKNYPCTVVSI